MLASVNPWQKGEITTVVSIGNSIQKARQIVDVREVVEDVMERARGESLDSKRHTTLTLSHSAISSPGRIP